MLMALYTIAPECLMLVADNVPRTVLLQSTYDRSHRHNENKPLYKHNVTLARLSSVCVLKTEFCLLINAETKSTIII